ARVFSACFRKRAGFWPASISSGPATPCSTELRTLIRAISDRWTRSTSRLPQAWEMTWRRWLRTTIDCWLQQVRLGCRPRRPPDKPTVIFAPPASPDVVSDGLTFKVPDCRAAYEALKSRGGDISHSTARVRLGDPLLLSRSRRTPAGDQSVQSPVGPGAASAGPVPDARRRAWVSRHADCSGSRRGLPLAHRARPLDEQGHAGHRQPEKPCERWGDQDAAPMDEGRHHRHGDHTCGCRQPAWNPTVKESRSSDCADRQRLNEHRDGEREITKHPQRAGEAGIE